MQVKAIKQDEHEFITTRVPKTLKENFKMQAELNQRTMSQHLRYLMERSLKGAE